MQQIGVIALLGGWLAPCEALIRVGGGREAGGPGLVGERWIGDDEVVGAKLLAVVELRSGEGVAAEDVRRREVVQDHVHAGETGGGHVLLLPFERDMLARFGSDLQQQRARSARRIISSRGGDGVLGRDADDLGDDPADLGGRVELALALAALRGEVPHQVLVGIAENVVVVSPVLREVEFWLLEDVDEVGQALHHRLAFAKLVGIVEVGEVAAGQAGVGSISGWMICMLILSPMSLLPRSASMSLKLAPLGMVTGGAKSSESAYLSEMYLMNSMNRT